MSSGGPLSTEQVAGYRERGYLLLRGLFDGDDVACWRRECDRLLAAGAAADPYDLRVGRRDVDGQAVVERFDPVQDVSPVFHELARDRRLLAALGQLLGDAPLLFKDKLIFKLPGMSGYTMHQDGAWWAGFPITAILTAMVAIDSAGADNGGLELFAGYHHELLSTPGELRNLKADEAGQVREADGHPAGDGAGRPVVLGAYPAPQRHQHRQPQPPPALPHLLGRAPRRPVRRPLSPLPPLQPGAQGSRRTRALLPPARVEPLT